MGTRASAADRVSAWSHGSATRSASSRSEANRSSGGGHPASSAPQRCARSTRLSISAPSASRATCPPSDPGPSRSRMAPSTDAAGRCPARRVRRPRSSISTRVLDAVSRSSQATFAAETRPATSNSARGSSAMRLTASMFETTDATSAASRWDAQRPPSRTRSSGPSMSTPSRRRVRRSETGTPASSSSQRGSMLSVGRSGTDERTDRAWAIAMTSAE